MTYITILPDSRTYSQGESLKYPNCPNCGSKPIKADAPPPHHQKLVCPECDRFIKWLPSPQSIETYKAIKARIKALVIKQNKLSKWPRQLAKLAEIEASMGGTAR